MAQNFDQFNDFINKQEWIRQYFYLVNLINSLEVVWGKHIHIGTNMFKGLLKWLCLQIIKGFKKRTYNHLHSLLFNFHVNGLVLFFNLTRKLLN